MNIVVRLWRNNITTTFLAGLVLLLPVVLTVIIIAWIVNVLKARAGPRLHSSAASEDGRHDHHRPRLRHAGVLARHSDRSWSASGSSASSPAARRRRASSARSTAYSPSCRSFRTIYNPVSRVVRLATDKTAGDFSGMAVVSCRLGGANGVDVLALLANQEAYLHRRGAAPRWCICPARRCRCRAAW